MKGILGFVAFCVGLVIGFVLLLSWASKPGQEYKAQCEQRGGIYVVSRNFDKLCIDKDAVLDYKDE